MTTELVLLKLGGSLITDKETPYTPRLEKLHELAHEIASALAQMPNLHLVLGHGSGSFGHAAARLYRTREGLSPTPTGDERRFYWKGFAEVWYRAWQLNRFVMDALYQAGLPAIALAPISAVTSREVRVWRWDLGPLRAALDAGLVPVVYGDVIFDEERGGTILSTEDLFAYLARHLRPRRILLAGLEAGVWEDFPARTRLVRRITLDAYRAGAVRAQASAWVDVTGGMAAKLELMFALIGEMPNLTAHIFSAEESGNLLRALRREEVGTELAAL